MPGGTHPEHRSLLFGIRTWGETLAVKWYFSGIFSSSAAMQIPKFPAGFDVRLRELRVGDAEAWSAYLILPGVITHTSWGDVSPAAIRTLIQTYGHAEGPWRWAIAGVDDALIGTVGLNEIALGQGRAELAYDLDPQYGGRGLATAAARSVVEWAHEAGFQRVQATVLDSNQPSIAVLERLGMQREGLLHAYRKVRGEPRNFWLYASVNIGKPC